MVLLRVFERSGGIYAKVANGRLANCARRESGFSTLRLATYEPRNLIAWLRKSGTTKQFRRRRADKTRALVATRMDTFSGWRARFGDGGITSTRGLSGAQFRRLQARSVFLLSRLNPPGRT